MESAGGGVRSNKEGLRQEEHQKKWLDQDSRDVTVLVELQERSP